MNPENGRTGAAVYIPNARQILKREQQITYQCIQ